MPTSLADEDWSIIAGFLPARWEQAAIELKALQRARGVSGPEALLRLILLHVSTGLSLRQTSVRARALGLANVSDVALLKRLRAAEPWLRGLCQEMTSRVVERVNELPARFADRRLRAIDATTVQEAGAVGASWRLHFSIGLPSLQCDFFELTDFKGGESFRRFPAQPGDILLADRGYAHRLGVAHLVAQQADYVVRLVAQSFPLLTTKGLKFDAGSQFGQLDHAPRAWEVFFQADGRRYPARLCAVRKSALATERARRKAIRKSARNGSLQPDAENLALAEFVYVLTSLPAESFSATSVLELYRLRWQIELVFKRLKGLLDLGHLPKYDPASCRAWLQAKMLCALLIHELMGAARLFSPWGYGM
jgi:hypothetical protein